MYEKEEVIRIIGYHNWDSFDMFMIGRPIEYDEETEFELYTAQDIDDFKSEYGLN